MFATALSLLPAEAGWFATAFSMVWVWILFFLYVLLVISALFGIFGSDLAGGSKFLWILIIIFMPFFGSLLWFLLGRTRD